MSLINCQYEFEDDHSDDEAEDIEYEEWDQLGY